MLNQATKDDKIADFNSITALGLFDVITGMIKK